jgi:chaperonin cofactor prefoldin
MSDQETQKAITATLVSRWQDQSKLAEQLDKQIADMEEQITRLRDQKTFIERDVELLGKGLIGSREAEHALLLVEFIDKRK